jgi:DUF4097 and DUF4098 domain-containing protein YvlB
MKKFMPNLRIITAAIFLLAGWAGLSALEDLPLVNTETVSLEGISVLSISYGHGDLMIREGDSERLVIREYMSRDNPRYYAEISRNADAVRIGQGRRPWFFGFSFRSRAEIFLPPSFRENLRILNSSGNLSGDANLLGYKTIDVSVGSGSVLLNRLSGETVSIRVSSGGLNVAAIGGNSFVSVSSGRLEIGELAGTEHRVKVSSGRTRIGDLEGNAAIEIRSGSIAVEKTRGRIDLTISSGSVTVGDFSGEGNFELSAGDLNLDVRELTGDLRFRLTSGSADMNIPVGLGFNLDAITNSGSVRVNEGGVEALRVSGNSTVLRPIGPVPDPAAEIRTIYARTNSGNITINRR